MNFGYIKRVIRNIGSENFVRSARGDSKSEGGISDQRLFYARTFRCINIYCFCHYYWCFGEVRCPFIRSIKYMDTTYSTIVRCFLYILIVEQKAQNQTLSRSASWSQIIREVIKGT